MLVSAIASATYSGHHTSGRRATGIPGAVISKKRAEGSEPPLPATDFVSVVKKIEVQNDKWITPELADSDLASEISGVIPIGGETRKGSGGVTLAEVSDAQVAGDKYFMFGEERRSRMDLAISVRELLSSVSIGHKEIRIDRPGLRHPLTVWSLS